MCHHALHRPFAVSSLSSEVLLTIAFCDDGKTGLFLAFSLFCLFLGEGSNKLLRLEEGTISLNFTRSNPKEQSN